VHGRGGANVSDRSRGFRLAPAAARTAAHRRTSSGNGRIGGSSVLSWSTRSSAPSPPTARCCPLVERGAAGARRMGVRAEMGRVALHGGRRRGAGVRATRRGYRQQAMLRAAAMLGAALSGSILVGPSVVPKMWTSPCVSGTADGVVLAVGPRWLRFHRVIQWTPTPHAASGTFQVTTGPLAATGSPLPEPGQLVTVVVSCGADGGHADQIQILNPD
jgi:hypothetical protein